MKRKISIIGIAVGALLLAGVFFYRHFLSSPEYSLLQIRSALEHHNYREFEKYVDVDQTMSGLIDQAFEILQGPEKKHNTWSYFSFGFLDVMKPKLTLMYKPEIQKFVEGGAFDAEKPLQQQGNNPLADLWKRHGLVSLTGIVYEKVNGDTALVGIGIKPVHFDTVLVINIKMHNKGDYWRVSGLTGLAAFQGEMERLEQKRVDSLNVPIISKMSNTLKMGRFDKVTVDEHTQRTKAKLLIGMENTGNKIISEYTIVLGFSDLHHNLKKEIRINTRLDNTTPEDLSPKATQTLEWPRDGNMPLDSWVYITPLTEMAATVRIESIQFADGSTLLLRQKWQPD